MNTFQLYLNIGIEHIVDYKAYDHMLFLLTLCGVYMLRQWRQILILITAFTIGHTISLASSVLGIVSIPAYYVEVGIALTILATSIGNLLTPAGINNSGRKIKYAVALIFGVIHGFGFSNYLASLLGDGDLIIPLLSFNVGVEIGQIIIVTAILLIAVAFTSLLRIVQRDWTMVVSGAGIGVSLVMLLERF